MNRNILIFLLMAALTCFALPAYCQEEGLTVTDSLNKRDPFVPLLDENGSFRAPFQGSHDNLELPQVKLEGIVKINGAFFAIIDGQLLKEGNVIKGLRLEEVDFDRIVLSYFGKKETLQLSPEKQK